MEKLKQCPRCKNEELKGTENYCFICGLDLKATAQKVAPIEQSIGWIENLANHLSNCDTLSR